MDTKRRRAVLRLVFDLGSIAIVGIPVAILFLVAKPYRRGFYCDDSSLMHPYKENTIPTWVAGFVGVVLPSILILVIEFVNIRSRKQTLNVYFVECYQLFMPFFFGAAVTQLTTDIAKYTVGRLRPHFLTVCQPVLTTCTINTGFIDGDDVCTGSDLEAIQEARLSFPSGHSSIAFYCMIWLIVYLQYRFVWKQYWLVRPLFQALCFYLAYYCALSRISDYMHHWSDVLAGSIIGAVVALLDIFFMSHVLPGNRNTCRGGLPMHSVINSSPTSGSDRLDV